MIGGGRSGCAAGRREPAHGQGHAEEAKAGREGRRMAHKARNATGLMSILTSWGFRICET